MSDPPNGAGDETPRRLLLVVVGLQLVLAVFAQAGRVYLDDEVGTWRAVSGSFGAIFTSFDEWQTQPGYFLFAKLAALPLGASELALRLPALLFGLLLTVAVYALVARLVDGWGGLLSAALVGLHPFVLFYSQMARGYTMAMALVVVSLVCVQRLASGEGGRWTGIVCMLARAGSVYAHLGACATVVAEVLLAVAVARSSSQATSAAGRADWWRSTRRALVWVAAGGLLSLALYAPLLSGMLAFRERWTGESLGGFTFGFVPLVARVYGGGEVLGGALQGLGFIAGTTALLVRARTRLGAVALLAGILAVLGFYAALDTAHYPWAFARFLTPALPLLFVLSGAGLRVATRSLGGRALAAVLALLVFSSYWDSLRIAFGPKDLSWSRVFDELAEGGPRTLVLAPVRFHAAEPYMDRLAGKGVRVLRVEQLPEHLARGGVEQLAANPLTILQDVVPIRDRAGSGPAGFFELDVRGATAMLTRNRPVDDFAELLAALRSLAEDQIAFLEPRERQPITGRWVFWRLDAQHEHPFVATLSNGSANALLAVTAGLMGDEATSQAALERARQLQGAVPVPGDVASAW